MKIAIVHDWLTTLGGAEKVVMEFHKLFPDAPIYTTVYNEKKLGKLFKDAKIKTSIIQKLPFGIKKYRWYLPIMPIVFEQFDLSEYDVIISSCSSCAKGINKNASSVHICYCHTPIRYVWDMYNKYNNKGFIKKAIIAKMIHKLRIWDQLAANRVDQFIANSNYINKRIESHYRKKAEVIYPPVEIDKFIPKAKVEVEDYYFVISRLVDYKRIDLLIKTFNEIGLKLIIAGDGPEKKKYQKLAKDNIKFVGFISDDELVNYYQKCKAFVYAGEEDFGIVLVEAQAARKTCYSIW